MPKAETQKNSEISDKAETKFSGKYFYAVGRRKTAAARVKIYAGQHGYMINGRDYKDFFPYFEWQDNIVSALRAVGQEGKYGVDVKVAGGGQLSQSEACRLGVARALLKVDENFKKSLRGAGFLTRDPRSKERKKPGLKRARRAPQWSKR